MAAYRIGNVTGSHLTAVNKRDISHMLAHDMRDGRTRAGIAYSLTPGEIAGTWHVLIVKTERDDWGRPQQHRSRSTFTATAVREIARV